MTLALFGGNPLRQAPYPPFKTTGREEIDAVVEVLERGVLSDFEGGNNELFLGGDCIRKLENEWADYFECRHTASFNSATSGLYAAVAAAGVGPGDEVITTPWTMTATATAIIVNHAVPVFADIDPITFCISANDIERKITPRTKALIPVHIYGHPADMDPIMQLADDNGIMVIEDAAQSMGAKYKGRQTGTIGHMGVHSMNSHKLIQSGEGGLVMTNDDELSLKLQLIRNHAESVIATGKTVKSLVNMVGWNYRMTEIEAAICSVQLTKLASLQAKRSSLARYLTDQLRQFDGLILPFEQDNCDHTYYRYAVRLDHEKVPILAATFVEALNAEGLDWLADYIPINQFPMYQRQTAFGDKGCPFKCPHYQGIPDYSMDTLPNVSHHLKYSFSTENVRPPVTIRDINLMVEGFSKVFDNMNQLIEHEKKRADG